MGRRKGVRSEEEEVLGRLRATRHWSGRDGAGSVHTREEKEGQLGKYVGKERA